MALIKCPECGKEISDKAASCPNCGNPMDQPIVVKKTYKPSPTPKSEDALVCPKCNSTQLTSNKKGFSGGKAIAGAVITGGIGILAGTIGSGKIVITCLKCGYKFKAGEYESEKKKFDEKRRNQIYLNKQIAAGNVSSIPGIIVAIAFTIVVAIISYLLLSNDWIILGVVFGLITLVCISFTISLISDERKKEKNNSQPTS